MKSVLRRCPMVECSFVESGEILDPSLEKHVESTHKCPACDEMFLTIRGVARHIDWRHENTYKCGMKSCFYFTNENISILKQHYRDRHNIHKTYECDECKRLFCNAQGYSRHMNSAHSGKKQIRKRKLPRQSFNDQQKRRRNAHNRIRISATDKEEEEFVEALSNLNKDEEYNPDESDDETLDEEYEETSEEMEQIIDLPILEGDVELKIPPTKKTTKITICLKNKLLYAKIQTCK